MTNEQAEKLSQAIRDAFVSPNVMDSNMEPANVVDALAMIAKAGFAISVSLDMIRKAFYYTQG